MQQTFCFFLSMQTLKVQLFFGQRMHLICTTLGPLSIDILVNLITYFFQPYRVQKLFRLSSGISLKSIINIPYGPASLFDGNPPVEPPSLDLIANRILVGFHFLSWKLSFHFGVSTGQLAGPYGILISFNPHVKIIANDYHEILLGQNVFILFHLRIIDKN